MHEGGGRWVGSNKLVELKKKGSYFLVVVRLRLLVRDPIKCPQIIGNVYPKSENFKVLKVR